MTDHQSNSQRRSRHLKSFTAGNGNVGPLWNANLDGLNVPLKWVVAAKLLSTNRPGGHIDVVEPMDGPFLGNRLCPANQNSSSHDEFLDKWIQAANLAHVVPLPWFLGPGVSRSRNFLFSFAKFVFLRKGRAVPITESTTVLLSGRTVVFDSFSTCPSEGS